MADPDRRIKVGLTAKGKRRRKGTKRRRPPETTAAVTTSAKVQARSGGDITNQGNEFLQALGQGIRTQQDLDARLRVGEEYTHDRDDEDGEDEYGIVQDDRDELPPQLTPLQQEALTKALQEYADAAGTVAIKEKLGTSPDCFTSWSASEATAQGHLPEEPSLQTVDPFFVVGKDASRDKAIRAVERMARPVRKTAGATFTLNSRHIQQLSRAGWTRHNDIIPTIDSRYCADFWTSPKALWAVHFMMERTMPHTIIYYVYCKRQDTMAVSLGGFQ